MKRGLQKGEACWRIILSLGRKANGKPNQRWVTFRGTRKQGEQKLRELTGEVDLGEFIEPSKMTLGDYLDRWLDLAVKRRKAKNTYDSYAGVVRNHIKPALGHLPLQAVTPLHIERYYAQLQLSPSSM